MRPVDHYGFGVTVLFYSIQFTARWPGTTGLIFDGVRSLVAVFQSNGTPEIDTFLADEYIEEITAVIVIRHGEDFPGDVDFVAISYGVNAFGRAIKHAGAGQVYISKFDSVNIAHHIHDRGGHPAEIIELVEFNVEPLAVNESSAHGTDIARI